MSIDRGPETEFKEVDTDTVDMSRTPLSARASYAPGVPAAARPRRRLSVLQTLGRHQPGALR
jgi:hypothetical protein